MSKPEREAALEEVLEEAARLLRIAFVALYRLRLIDRGHDCSLSHELREFALEFSENDESGKHGVFRTGSGAYKSWRENVRALASTPPKPAAEDVVEHAARVLAKTDGHDPDELAPTLIMCSADNEAVPYWRVYEEQAIALAAANLLRTDKEPS